MTQKEQTKKKSIVKKILKWSGITLLLLIVALILIPIFFKEQLKDLALKEANKMLKADVALGDFDLTFFSSFPNMILEFDDVSITGRDDFAGVQLMNIKKIEANLGFWSVIAGDNVEIGTIRLIEPKFDVRVLESGEANYDIVKSSEEIAEEYGEEEEESAFKLTLTGYSIENGYVYYKDEASNMFAELVNLNHAGKGDLTADVIDFETTTTMDAFTYKMDGINYLSEVKTDFVMNLLMEFKEESDKYTLKENELQLNAVKMSFDGYYEMFEDHDYMDLNLKADKTTFKDLLSLIPSFYQSGYESMIASGSIDIGGKVVGRMDETNLPAWDFKTNISNASINYPDAPSAIEKIALKASSNFPGGDDLDKMGLNVSTFHAEFAGNTMDANLLMTNPMTDPYIKSRILANVDLSKIDQVMPLADGESYNGILNSDLTIDGRLSALEREDYEAFKAEGMLELADFRYGSADFPDPLDVSVMRFLFSPKALKLDNLEGKMGASDFQMKGDVENYLGYIFRDEPLKGNFVFNSKNLDLDALMPASETETVSTETPEEDKASPTDVEPLLIPGNIDFVMATSIGKLKYDGMIIDDVKGQVTLRDETATLDNLTMKALDGEVGVSGNYNTQNHKEPKFDFAYKLKDVDINQLASNFVTIDKLAPIAKYANGKVSSDFNMTGVLRPDFEPVYNSLTGAGTLSTKEVQIAGFKPLERLSEVMDIDEIKNGTFKNIRSSFQFSDGKIHLREALNVKLGQINASVVEGFTTFEQEIDYRLKLDVPKSYVPKAILDAAEKAVAAAQRIPGFKMKELPAMIPVNALLTNTVTDPKIQTDFKEQLMALGGDMKDAVKDLINEKVEQLKDTVKAVVQDKIEDVTEELQRRKQKLIDDAQVQADKVVSDAKVLADRTRREGEVNAQRVIDEAGSNPIKLRAAEITAKKIRDEANDKANKIESEAKKRSDQIMKEARDKADKLE
jgi:hypothetical protein